ncbi:uncharacterized protein LOC123263742 [Cotesia glomerata]|uniref:Uncharacterized protein n=1 Tax=Cotesia glomerata TaxID=32391 RepID=A0AAV7ILC2_COTGL|nr:uncharacterized protein LOC123263742 [Cotesia glomerata]KAH0554868.1 hypothetical protein KQX54_013476 [Cotesia glomerata]
MKIYIERTLLALALLFAYSDALYLEDSTVKPEARRFTYKCSSDFATLYFKPDDTTYAVAMVVDKNKPECRTFKKNNSYYPPALEVNFSNCSLGLKIFDVLLAELGVFENMNTYYETIVDCEVSDEQYDTIFEYGLSKVESQ